ncbi:MAG: ParB/RepB/Spo0J family partition protein [Bacteroidales bacterium]|nr:ParB/RepB/Spo0J family partition protein [Bacteroidales bacterium]
MAKKNALGRGLDALIDTSRMNREEPEQLNAITEIDLSLIETNPFQPRTIFDDEALVELADSIKELGIIQPITLRILENNKFQIISGERRWRASKLAGLITIPAYIRSANDQEMLEMALVENIQRENLNAIEIAISYQRLIDECSLTHDLLGQRIGKNRSTITNYTRLLNLPAKIQSGIKTEKISMGHAKALLGIKDEDIQLMVYDQILKYDFSVRKVEDTVKELNKEENSKEKKHQQKSDSSSDYLDLQNQLSSKLETDVLFKRNFSGNGKIVIPFKNDNDLERIIALLDKINI